ncbi:DUF3813 domain-containing protein [Bacillus fonticola]|uniref:DUF3813 domain-containing protein n=1 Tax=Bacillus fonticola TaxID=2728853 RepID=UPI0014766FBF|nr:DUF3813 domain-containing protein [Bacillus fonticola]
MGNKLFQQAKEQVTQSIASLQNQSAGDRTIEEAKNALSSAYANSTPAEQEQLRKMQMQLQEAQSQQ